MAEEYRTPAAFGEAAFTEKRSRFLGRIWPVQTEAEALRILKEIRTRHWDATHNVYAYILRENGAMRYSDDGEPQGSSGMPTLHVLRTAEVTDVLCIVTRYFGGILLGVGGLQRAYSQAARLALEAAGVGRVRLWDRLLIACPYALYERTRRELEGFGAVIDDTDFGKEVTLEALLAKGGLETLNARLRELSAGSVEAIAVGEEYRAVREAS